jgi:hypothetical protein
MMERLGSETNIDNSTANVTTSMNAFLKAENNFNNDKSKLYCHSLEPLSFRFPLYSSSLFLEKRINILQRLIRCLWHEKETNDRDQEAERTKEKECLIPDSCEQIRPDHVRRKGT